MMTLFGYFRSSAAYRVRIALALKGIDISHHTINLRKGEQKQPSYLALNPQGLVPIVDIDGNRISQSLAIIEYIEQQYPQPALLPSSAFAMAQVRSLSYQIAMDIHPLNNLRVLQYLENNLHISAEQKNNWYQHWVHEGLSAIEQTLLQTGKAEPYCFGQNITMADVCLVPQVYNARRFNCDLSQYPLIHSIDGACNERMDFQSALPENQSDA